MSIKIKNKNTNKIICYDNGKRKVVGGLTIVRSLFKPRKTSCFLIDLRSAISSGNNNACSTASAT